MSSLTELGVDSAPEPPRTFDPDALTRALRIAGAALVVASASTFMLQHWQGGNDLWRYTMLVGQSLLLAAAAYFVGLSLREGRSARTFLALVLGTMPVSFAVLGGLVYSQFHLEVAAPVPQYATWVAPSELSALLAVAGTLAVLVPLALVSFLTLARKQARLLTAVFFAANLLVLVPVRQPLAVVALAGVALIAMLRLELRRFFGAAQMDTREARLARAVLFAPPLLMLGRVFHLYHPGAAFVGGVLMIAAAALWLYLPRAESLGKRDLGACISAALAVAGWGLCCSELLRHVHGAALSVLAVGLPAAALFGLASLRASTAEGGLLSVAVVLGLLTTLIAGAVGLDTLSALVCIVVGIAVAVWGASMRALLRTVTGSLVALFGLGVQVWLAVQADNVLRWLSLSVVGILLIVGSAYVERNRTTLAHFWDRKAPRRLEEQDA
jgi:hypothetical protein